MNATRLLLSGIALLSLLELHAQASTVLNTSTNKGINSVVIGVDAGTSLPTVAVNPNTGPLNNTYVGWNSGNTATGSYNTFLGADTGIITSGAYNTFIGDKSGRDNTGVSNVFVGAQSGQHNKGNANIFIGRLSGLGNQEGANNVYLGTSSGQNNNGNNNTYIGSNAGDRSNKTIFTQNAGNVFIGFRAGYNTNVSNKLYIHNAESTTPLVYGDFESQYVNINNMLGIGLPLDQVPLAKLEVNGTLKVNTLPIATTNTYFLSTDASGNVKKQLLNMTGAPSNLVLTGDVLTLSNPLTAGNSVKLPNIYNTNGTLTGERVVAMNNNRLIFDTEANGRIYVGNTLTTPSPFNTSNFPAVTGANDNYKLLVEGGILSEKIKVALRSGADWKDSVFASDYPLMSLNKVEEYVKENKHLPGIESAEELVKKGLDLGDMQAKQMGKIEELTLYVIEQNKTLEKQNKEIEELKAMVKVLMEKK